VHVQIPGKRNKKKKKKKEREQMNSPYFKILALALAAPALTRAGDTDAEVIDVLSAHTLSADGGHAVHREYVLRGG
jgi:myosin-crossreactive antigen